MYLIGYPFLSTVLDVGQKSEKYHDAMGIYYFLADEDHMCMSKSAIKDLFSCPETKILI